MRPQLLRHTIDPAAANPGSLCPAPASATKYGPNVTLLAGSSNASSCYITSALVRAGPAPALATRIDGSGTFVPLVALGDGSAVYTAVFGTKGIQKLDTATGTISAFLGEPSHAHTHTPPCMRACLSD